MINNIDKTKSNIFNITKEKKNKRKRKKHDGYFRDNLKQRLIRHFINYLIYFINLIVNKMINNKEIKFQINYKDKRFIKIEHIVEFNIEKILLFKPIKNQKNGIKSNEMKTGKINNYNQNQLNKIKKEIGSSLDLLFKTRVIDIFKELYYQKVKIILDLKKYGIEGVKLNLDEHKRLKNYEDLRINCNKEKRKKIVAIIENEIFNYNKLAKKKKKIHFNTKKEE